MGSMIKRILNIRAPFGFENGSLGRLIVLSVVSMFETASIAANSRRVALNYN